MVVRFKLPELLCQLIHQPIAVALRCIQNVADFFSEAWRHAVLRRKCTFLRGGGSDSINRLQKRRIPGRELEEDNRFVVIGGIIKMPLGYLEKHGIIRLVKGSGIDAVVFGGNLAVLHYIAMGREHAALTLAHLSADFGEVQIFVDFIRYPFQCRYKIIIRIKFAERRIVMSFIGNLAMLGAVCHIDEPLH